MIDVLITLVIGVSCGIISSAIVLYLNKR